MVTWRTILVFQCLFAYKKNNICTITSINSLEIENINNTTHQQIDNTKTPPIFEYPSYSYSQNQAFISRKRYDKKSLYNEEH